MKSEHHSAAKLLSYFEESRAEILEFMRWLVEQESMSREAEATTRIAENLGEHLSQMGADVELFREPRYGATLRASFQQTASDKPTGGKSGRQDDAQLLGVGHLDTVWPIGTLAVRPFRVEN